MGNNKSKHNLYLVWIILHLLPDRSFSKNAGKRSLDTHLKSGLIHGTPTHRNQDSIGKGTLQFVNFPGERCNQSFSIWMRLR
jgi:hypothetical protein